jgi:hypothetical protein
MNPDFVHLHSAANESLPSRIQHAVHACLVELDWCSAEDGEHDDNNRQAHERDMLFFFATMIGTHA